MTNTLEPLSNNPARDFGMVLILDVAVMIFMTALMLRVGTMRGKDKVPAPETFKEGADRFNVAQRVYLNTLETLPTFYVLLNASGFVYPILATAFGGFWLLCRIGYAVGYSIKPKYRTAGFVGQLLALTALAGLTVTAAARLFIIFKDIN